MSLRYLFLLAILLGLTTPSWGQKETCIYCKGDTLLVRLEYVDGPKSVCQMCQKKYPHCSLCGLPTNLPRYRDGRTFCPSCQKVGVFTESAAKALQQQVLSFLNGLLGPSPLPPIRMCDKDELQTKFIEHGRSLNVGGFYSPYNPEMVYLLTGEPALELEATMAHEYTHAWQSRNCGPQDRALTEGFATLVQYKYLLSRGESDKAERLKRHRDPDYGASLVRLLERERSLGGMKSLVEWVKKAKNLDK